MVIWVSFSDRRDIAGVNQSEINHIDRNLRIVDGLQFVPDQLLAEFGGLGFCNSRLFQAKSVGIFSFNAPDLPLIVHPLLPPPHPFFPSNLSTASHEFLTPSTS